VCCECVEKKIYTAAEHTDANKKYYIQPTSKATDDGDGGGEEKGRRRGGKNPVLNLIEHFALRL